MFKYNIIKNPLGTFYYLNGTLHREGGPAVENSYKKEWFKNGKLHREDGPAIEYANGERYWYRNNILHREDGPAIEKDGIKEWYKNGKLHREDGPAIKWGDDIFFDKNDDPYVLYWYFNNKLYGINEEFTNESWKKFIKTLIFA